MQVKHLGPFPCIICDRSCPTTKLLKRHMLTHTKVETDQPSSRRFVNYCKYLQIDPNGTFTCKECKQKFDTRKRFRTHVVESHDKSKNFFCQLCDKGFTLAWQLNSHVENTVRTEWVVERRMLTAYLYSRLYHCSTSRSSNVQYVACTKTNNLSCSNT